MPRPIKETLADLDEMERASRARAKSFSIRPGDIFATSSTKNSSASPTTWRCRIQSV